MTFGCGLRKCAGQRARRLFRCLAVTLTAIAAPNSAAAADNSVPSDPSSPGTPAYPLKVGATNRYLVDQHNVPFLMVGDSPQTMIANLSETEAKTYIANREAYGINTLWINLLCNFSDGCNKNATTFDGVPPFIIANNLSTPNPIYFERADRMISIAADHGMVVLLDPIETSSWLEVLRANGTAKAFAYGQYLGTRYESFPNIIWMHGNDFQSWGNKNDDALVQAVARGIKSTDSNHIHTVELNYLTSGSLDDPSWSPLIELNAAYTYFPTYSQVLTEYNRPEFKPVFMVEANYEFEHNSYTDGGSPENLRRQEYWTMLSGATGQVYGSAFTWRFAKGWHTNLDTPGAIQLGYMKNLFVSRKWYDLIPDQDHTVVTAGYHGFSCFIGRLLTYVGRNRAFIERMLPRIRQLSPVGSMTTNTCATAARAADGSVMIAYLPSPRSITVDMSKLSSRSSARWYDPTSGVYKTAIDSPLANVGSKIFTPPVKNSAGDGDWVLVIEPQSTR
jgi:hypothetical protein